MAHGCLHPIYEDFICTVPGCPNGYLLNEEQTRFLDELCHELSKRAQLTCEGILGNPKE